RKDKTFFFTAYEALIRRESAYTTILSDRSILQPTPNQQNLINTLIGSGQPAFVAQGQQLQALLTTAPNSPFPLNRRTYNLLAGSTGAFPILQTASTGSVRVDHGLSEQDFIFFRYSLTNDSQHNIAVGGLTAPSAGFDIGSRDNTFVLGETHVFRNGLSNEFPFHNIRNIYNVNTVDPFRPRYQIAGIGVFGPEFASPSDGTQRRVQFVDNFSLPRGRHNIKFGGDFSRFTIDTISAVFLGGTIGFTPLPIPLGQALGAGASTQLVTALSTPREAGGLGRARLPAGISTGPLAPIPPGDFRLCRSLNH